MRQSIKKGRQMSTLRLGQVEGILPNCRHHFSTLILHRNTYFELTGKYHKKYPSKIHYEKWWKFRFQMNSQASEAVKARALAVLRRARLAPFDFRYMTTAYLKNNRLRHISVVKLPDGDFIKLSNMGVLRKLHEVGEDMSKEELIRHVIYGLSPFTILLEQKAA